MSGETTRKMIRALMIPAPSTMFLSGWFQSPPANFHNSEEVEFDIEREDEDIAVVIQDLSAGARSNEASRYTNKSFKPPIFSEKGTITAFDLVKRQIGETPFQDPRYQANAMFQAGKIIRKLNRKIRRSVEEMASQVLQTGQLALKDDAGATLYSLDFKAKATHLATVSTTWAADGATGDPEGDLAALADVVRKDGKRLPTDLIFGNTAWTRFLANTTILKRIEHRRADMIDLPSPRLLNSGASYMGDVVIRNYPFRMWTYNAEYKNPNGGALTSYVNAEYVIMMSAGARLDLTFGNIPTIGGPEARALQFLPRRLSDGAEGLDVITNAWLTEGNEHLVVKTSARPLTIPSEIDSFARLDITA